MYDLKETVTLKCFDITEELYKCEDGDEKFYTLSQDEQYNIWEKAQNDVNDDVISQAENYADMLKDEMN